MFIRKNKILSQSGATIPFGNFLTILKFWVKDKDWASPHMRSKQVPVISLGLGQEFQRCETRITARQPIVKPNCMIHRKRPQRKIINSVLRPVKRHMDQKCSGHGHD
eukprot:scaffold136161_cov36-Cyclotella_meneghiniana.AAC.2